MQISTRFIISSVLGVLLALPVATAVRSAGDHEGGHGHGSETQGHGEGFPFGRPAGGARPDRTIEITASDQMTFIPERVDVKAGQVVRFVVKNTGSLHHSFTIGTDDWHQHHEEEMQGMKIDTLVTHMRDEPNGVVIPPGGTRQLTWKFTSGGAVQFGCHVPGHFPAGMKGKIHIG